MGIPVENPSLNPAAFTALGNALNVPAKATQPVAEAGTDDLAFMTSLKTKQQADARLSTQAEAEAGSNNTQTMTPLRSKQQIDARLADQATAEAGTDNFELMTPLRTEQRIDKQFGNWVSVLTFGAKCDGVTDDTAAFEAACRSLPYPYGGTVYAPNGKYLIGTLDISYCPNLTFDWQGEVVAKNATGHVIDANNCSGLRWENPRISMKSGVVKTQGAFINLLRTSFYEITGGYLQGHYIGIEADGGSIGVLRDIKFRNGTPSSVAPGSGHIRVGNTEFCVVVLLDNIVADNDTADLFNPTTGEMTTFGICLKNIDAPLLSNLEIMRSGTGLMMNPGSGQSCINGFIHDSYFDTADYGIVTGGGGGSVVNHTFTSVWTGGHNHYGRYIGALSNSIRFLHCQASLCTDGGSIMTDGSFGVRWFKETGAGNGGPAIVIAAGQEDFKIQQCELGARDAYFTENVYPIYVDASCDNYIISDNDLRGNTNPMNDGSAASATQRWVSRNLGYATAAKGVATITAGNTSVVVAHGLVGTPHVSDIAITTVGDPGGRQIYLDPTSLTSTNFTVRMNGTALGYNLSVTWQADLADALA